MCGTVGFFVGCKMADKCLKGKSACSLIKNADAMKNWYEKARVRHSDRHMLNEEDIEGHIFPPELAPVLEHSLVKSLDGESITQILNNHLFRYFDFTVKLELAVVNDVVKDMIFKQTAFLPDDQMIIDAHKIYVDEGYHALFSHDLMMQAKSILDVEPILPKSPRFLKVLNRILANSDDVRQRRLIQLMFVIVSETLITSSLTDIRQQRDIPKAIRSSINDHALDEARHHAFFSGLLISIWPQLSAEDRRLSLMLIPEFIFAFVEPDTNAIVAELSSFNLSKSDADIVVNETYDRGTITSFAQHCASSLLSLLTEIPEFHETAVRDKFFAHGLLDSNNSFSDRASEVRSASIRLPH